MADRLRRGPATGTRAGPARTISTSTQAWAWSWRIRYSPSPSGSTPLEPQDVVGRDPDRPQHQHQPGGEPLAVPFLGSVEEVLHRVGGGVRTPELGRVLVLARPGEVGRTGPGRPARSPPGRSGSSATAGLDPGRRGRSGLRRPAAPGGPASRTGAWAIGSRGTEPAARRDRPAGPVRRLPFRRVTGSRRRSSNGGPRSGSEGEAARVTWRYRDGPPGDIPTGLGRNVPSLS